MQTRRLYYEDAYQKTCAAKVLSCRPAGDHYQVILDQTVFYPEGGGQPADQGYLGTARVFDVQIIEEELVHFTDQALREESYVTASIDWKRRFDFMQQHAGEHIVSGMIHNKYGYDNVGFHMGADCITIDLSGPLSKEQLDSLEEEVNAYIWTNQSSRIRFLTEEEIKTEVYRSKKELSGEVRLVEFPGADICACCGLHVDQTGEIGLVKLLNVKKFHDGVRIEMLCGRKAVEYLRIQDKQNKAVAISLSVKAEETAEAVSKINQEIYDLRGEIAQIKDAFFRKQASLLENRGNVLLIEEGMSPVDLRKCADLCMKTCAGICCVISGNDQEGYKYAIGIKEGKIREFVKEVNEILRGRGGGKEHFAQGSFSCKQEEIIAFFQEKGFQVMQ